VTGVVAGITMNTAALIEKIEDLPRDEREAVEGFVAQGQANALNALHPRRSAPEAEAIMERVRARRESIFRRRGLLDSAAILRDVREHGE
jgi:hypothetical protein